jgi:hypothetical protein
VADTGLSVSQLSEKWVLTWASEHKGDKSFAKSVYFLTQVLIPYAMMKAGIRTKYYHLYDAGRLLLYPLIYSRNRCKYGPLIAHDLIMIHYLSSEQIFGEMTGPLFGFMRKGVNGELRRTTCVNRSSSPRTPKWAYWQLLT